MNQKRLFVNYLSGDNTCYALILYQNTDPAVRLCDRRVSLALFMSHM